MDEKPYEWDPAKNEWLKAERDISFEDIVAAIQEGGLLGYEDHPQKAKYGHQKMIYVLVDEYVFLVPCIEDERKYFLKTIFASRKMTKLYLQSKKKKI